MLVLLLKRCVKLYQRKTYSRNIVHHSPLISSSSPTDLTVPKRSLPDLLLSNGAGVAEDLFSTVSQSPTRYHHDPKRVFPENSEWPTNSLVQGHKRTYSTISGASNTRHSTTGCTIPIELQTAGGTLALISCIAVLKQSSVL